MHNWSESTPPARRRSGRQACVICTSPRSGSYLLSEALEGTGCLGVPREYFDADKGKEKWWVDRLGIQGDQDYIDKVVAAGSTANGVFGLKIHWHQIHDLVNRFDRASAAPAANGRERTFIDCLQERFDSMSCLWLRRRNKVAQGISHYRAVKSGVWHVRPDLPPNARSAGPILKFDFDAIDRHVHEAIDYDKRWHQFFLERKIKTLMLIYEDFVRTPESYERTIRAICRHVGVDSEHVPIRAPAFRQQADELSLEWEKEYRRLKGNGTGGGEEPVTLRADARGRTRPRTAVTNVPTIATPPLQDAPKTAPQTTEIIVPDLAADSLVAYDLNPQLGVKIVKGQQRRDWMEATPGRFVYRCLPLVIANQHGWLLLCPARIQAVWNGEPSIESLTVEYPPNENRRFASSHFGVGILTFAMNFIFRTPPGISLHVRGPANSPKDGVSALEGIVETDWSEATFTMNWKMTRPGHPVVFEKDEPFAMLTPIALDEIERYRPEIRPIADNPALGAGYRRWADSRADFNKQLKVKDSEAQKLRWQRHYIKGETVTQMKARDHRTTVSLNDFLDKRK